MAVDFCHCGFRFSLRFEIIRHFLNHQYASTNIFYALN